MEDILRNEIDRVILAPEKFTKERLIEIIQELYNEDEDYMLKDFLQIGDSPEEVESTINDLEVKIDKLEDSISDLEDKLLDKDSEIDELEDKIKKLESEKSKLEDELSELGETCDNLEKELDSLRKF
ncbi:MAG: V-type ATP synthase subunit I [Bacteriophage sp.]|nr:MAG: V-type ATP synthase subunit I [Bacteriophage sp.]